MHTENKRICLPDGRFITRKLVRSDPADLANATPQEIWTVNDGRSNSGKTQYTRDILIRDMELSHLMNAILFLEREATEKLKTLGIGEPRTPEEAEKFKMAFNAAVRPQHAKMVEELDRRLGKLPSKNETPKDDEPTRHFRF